MCFPRHRRSHRCSTASSASDAKGSHDSPTCTTPNWYHPPCWYLACWVPNFESSWKHLKHSFFFNQQPGYFQHLDLDLDREIRWHSIDLGIQQLDVRLARARKAFVECGWQHQCNRPFDISWYLKIPYMFGSEFAPELCAGLVRWHFPLRASCAAKKKRRRPWSPKSIKQIDITWHASTQ